LSFAHLSAFDRVAEVGGKQRAGEVEVEVEAAPHEAAVYMCQLEVQGEDGYTLAFLLFSPVVSPRKQRRQLRGSALGTCSSSATSSRSSMEALRRRRDRREE
jgi:hypothetical protein